MKYGSLLASCLLTTCLFSSLLSSSSALQQELLKAWQVLFLFATCCSFGSACVCLCLLIGCPKQSVHLCIFTWMAGYVGVFLFRKEERADPLFFYYYFQFLNQHFATCNGRFQFLPGPLSCHFSLSEFCDARKCTLPILTRLTAKINLS